MILSYSVSDCQVQAESDITTAIAFARRVRMPRMATKSLSDAKQEAARKFLRRIVVEDFEENQSKAARGLGISQAQISDVLSSRRGLGYSALEILANYRGVSVEEVTGGKGADGETDTAEARARQAFLLITDPEDKDEALAYLREAEGVAQRLHGATGDELLDHLRSGFRIWKRTKANPDAEPAKLRDSRAVVAPPGKGPRRL